MNAAEFGRDGSVVLAGHAGESFSVFKLDDDDGSVLFDWKVRMHVGMGDKCSVGCGTLRCAGVCRKSWFVAVCKSA